MEKFPNKAEILTTSDGSPSLKLDGLEPMHSLAGALAESLYIYAEAVETYFQSYKETKILSVGLGLGYNELISIGLASKYATSITALHSFETIIELKNNFLGWMNSPELHPTTNLISDLLCEKMNFFKPQLIKNSSALLNSNTFKLYGDIITHLPNMKYTIILFDAFSQNSNANLWSENFLNNLLQNHTNSTCLFATYACVGKLNRALKNNGFTLVDKPGFAGKRQSTLATKGF